MSISKIQTQQTVKPDSHRKQWIDEVRGLAIICVVISHSGIDNSILPLFIYFFVPIFFFISGYLYKSSNQSIDIVSNRILYRLGIPYVVFTALHYIVFSLVKHDWSYLTEMTLRIPTGRGLWFFAALMSVEAIVYIFSKLQKCVKYDVFPYIAIFISLVEIMSVTYGEGLFWKVDIACCCIGYYYAGLLYKNSENLISIGKKASVVVLVLYLLLSLILYLNGVKQNVSVNIYSMPIINYSMSLLGCYVICSFCKYFSLGKIVSYIGKNTIIIFGTNLIIMLVLKKIIESVIPMDILNQYNNLYMLTVVSCAIVIACFMSFPVNKYLPIVVGNKRSKWQNHSK